MIKIKNNLNPIYMCDLVNVIKKSEFRGTVISVIGVALISDLKCAKSGETLEFCPCGFNNVIFVKSTTLLNLKLNSVDAVIGDQAKISHTQ